MEKVILFGGIKLKNNWYNWFLKSKLFRVAPILLGLLFASLILQLLLDNVISDVYTAIIISINFIYSIVAIIKIIRHYLKRKK